MYVKIKSSSKWIEKHWGKISSITVSLWSAIVFFSGWFSGVNATVKAVPVIKEEQMRLGNQYNSLNGKVDTLLTIMTYQVLGQKEAAREYVKSLPKSNP